MVYTHNMPVDYDTSKVRKCGVHGLQPLSAFSESYAQLKNGKRYPVFKCKECTNAKSKQKYRDNPQKHHALTKAWRRANPDRTREIVNASFARNKKQFLASAKVVRQERKAEVLSRYSAKEYPFLATPRCTSCSPAGGQVVHIAMLALDHIRGGGTQHRKGVGTGDNFYDWIIENDYPDGYRVLCHNCNFRSHLSKVRAAAATADPKYLKHRLSLRQKVFSYYSEGFPKCVCCGEQDHEVLAIDHVHGGGRKHRASLGYLGIGNNFYQWLRKNGFPDGYQVLCHNCNFARQLLGSCPHQAACVVSEVHAR